MREQAQRSLELIEDHPTRTGREGEIGQGNTSLPLLQDVMGRFPDLADMGYSWVLDLDAYSTNGDIHLQWLLLSLIADVNRDHPNLQNARPVAARMVRTREFMVSAVTDHGAIDFVFVSLGFIRSVRALANFYLNLQEIRQQYSGLEKSTYFRFNPYNFGDVGDLAHNCCESVRAAVLVLMATIRDLHLVDDADEAAEGGLLKVVDPPDGHRRDGELGRDLVNIGLTVSGAEQFIIAHELAHIFARHPKAARSQRDEAQSMKIEMDADRDALSLCLASSGAHKYTGTYEWFDMLPTYAISIGAASAYTAAQLSRVIESDPPSFHAETVERTDAELFARRMHLPEAIASFGNARQLKGFIGGSLDSTLKADDMLMRCAKAVHMKDANFGATALMSRIVPDILRAEFKISHRDTEASSEEVRSTQISGNSLRNISKEMSVNSFSELFWKWSIVPSSIYINCLITTEFCFARIKRTFGK